MIPSLFAIQSSHVRDVDGRVKASLLRCRLLGGRVVNREDGLLGLLARFHLDVARDSLLFGHCCGCVVCVCMVESGVVCVVERRRVVCCLAGCSVGSDRMESRPGIQVTRGVGVGMQQLASLSLRIRKGLD